MMREAKRRKLDAELIANGLIIISIAALVGGRLYHVIDAWDRYSANPIGALIPPYEGLGAPGGIITGVIALAILLRRWRQSPWGWVDVVGPAILVMQAIARWGNWFNQELYGLPTDLPWGLAIECAYRTAETSCSAIGESARFHPLFLYESLSGLAGALILPALGERLKGRIVPGLIGLSALAWYSVTRLLLEGFRLENWRVGDVPTAYFVMGGIFLVTLLIAVLRVRSAIPGGGTAKARGRRPQTKRRARR
jgi:phosphatidylglycerol:prolipoprotein diacylglycerol transferase